MSTHKIPADSVERIAQELGALSEICHCVAESSCELQDKILPYLGSTLGDLEDQVRTLRDS